MAGKLSTYTLIVHPPPGLPDGEYRIRWSPGFVGPVVSTSFKKPVKLVASASYQPAGLLQYVSVQRRPPNGIWAPVFNSYDESGGVPPASFPRVMPGTTGHFNVPPWWVQATSFSGLGLDALDALDGASESAFGLDSLDGSAFGGAKTDIHARVHPPPGPALSGPLTLRNSTGEVFPVPSPWTGPITISKPSGPGQSRGWMLALFRDGTRIWQMMSPVDLNYGGTADIHVTRPGKHGGAAFGAAVTLTPEQGLGIGMEVLNATLTMIATIAALELQRTGQVSAQTALWQQQLAALQGSTGGGQYLTAEQIAALQGLQGQVQQQQAALTPWYKEPAVMVPLAIVGGVILAAGTAMMVRGRADRPPWDDGWQAGGEWAGGSRAAWDY